MFLLKNVLIDVAILHLENISDIFKRINNLTAQKIKKISLI